MNWIITAYFTRSTQYEDHAKVLVESLKKFDLPHNIVPIDSLGDWYKNTQYKPTFLKQMLKNYAPHSVIYVDVDAVFCRYPTFFDELNEMSDLTLSAHILDHSKYRRKNHPPELLSGTIFLKNNEGTRIIVDKWIEECKKDPKLWDQRALEAALRTRKEGFLILPEEYCVIFDYMSSVENPVIKHFQASRTEKHKMKESQSGQVRVVRGPGAVRIKGRQ